MAGTLVTLPLWNWRKDYVGIRQGGTRYVGIRQVDRRYVGVRHMNTGTQFYTIRHIKTQSKTGHRSLIIPVQLHPACPAAWKRQFNQSECQIM